VSEMKSTQSAKLLFPDALAPTRIVKFAGEMLTERKDL
jgi:hypothetical protein